MPIVLAKTAKQKPHSEERWGKPKDDVRYICASKEDKSAVYAIEAPPGKRGLSFRGQRYTLWWPWTYFFVKVTASCTTSTQAPAYIMVANKRLRLDEKKLMIPYIPNSFAHGGICPDHNSGIKGATPLEAARKFIQWFWFSDGSGSFGKVRRPSHFDAYIGMATLLSRWASFSPKQVEQIDWQPARYRSIREAALHLRFNYWSRDHDSVSDMIRKRSSVDRVEIGGIE